VYAKICVQVSTFRNGADFAPGHVRSTQSINILQRVSNALDVKAERHQHTLGSIVIIAQDDQIYNAHSTEKKKGQKKRRNRKLLQLLSALSLSPIPLLLFDRSLFATVSALLSFPGTLFLFLFLFLLLFLVHGYFFNFHLFSGCVCSFTLGHFWVFQEFHVKK